MAEFPIELDEAIDKLENQAREIRADLKLCACAIGFGVVLLLLIMYFYSLSGMLLEFHSTLEQKKQTIDESLKDVLIILQKTRRILEKIRQSSDFPAHTAV